MSTTIDLTQLDFQTNPILQGNSFPDVKKEPLESDTEEATYCPICYEPWTTSGYHRVVSLKCGHLFGQTCIRKWFDRNRAAREQACPTCKAPFKRRDIRPIWASRISAIDSSEKETLMLQLNVERERRRQIEEESRHQQQSIKWMQEEIEQMKQQLLAVHSKNEIYYSRIIKLENKDMSSSQDRSRTKFLWLQSIEVGKEPKSCRVMAFDSELEMLIISRVQHISTSCIRHGLVKISMANLSSQDCYLVHDDTIRDIKCSPHDQGIVLTTSLDKTLKLSSSLKNSTISTYQLESPGWSCCFHPKNPHYLFCGEAKGCITVFDTRNSHLNSLLTINIGRPIHSLHFMENDHNVPSNTQEERNKVNGLIGGNIIDAFFVPLTLELDIETSTTVVRNSMPICTKFGTNGKCYAVSYNKKTNRYFASFRDNQSTPHSTIHIFGTIKYKKEEEKLEFCELKRVIGESGQIALSKTCLFDIPSKTDDKELKLFGSAGDEASSDLFVWHLPHHHEDVEPRVQLKGSTGGTGILDMKYCSLSNGKEFLCCLNDRILTIFSVS